MALTLTQMLDKAKEALPREAVAVPELGGEAWVSMLPSTRRDAFDESMPEDKAARLVNFRARLVAYCLCDEHGMFLCAEPAPHVAALGALPAPAIGRLYDAAARLNGFRDRDVEELGKN